MTQAKINKLHHQLVNIPRQIRHLRHKIQNASPGIQILLTVGSLLIIGILIWFMNLGYKTLVNINESTKNENFQNSELMTKCINSSGVWENNKCKCLDIAVTDSNGNCKCPGQLRWFDTKQICSCPDGSDLDNEQLNTCKCRNTGNAPSNGLCCNIGEKIVNYKCSK